jgi:hypothetical protein
VPAKPAWLRKLPYILAELRVHPLPYVDRATVENLLNVSRRRAQQIMAPCVTERVGSSALADREALIRHLERIAEGEEAAWELERQRKVAGLLARLRQDRISRPHVLVEAPAAVIHQAFESLPPGVQLSPGRILVEFSDPRQALEKLLALAMAIGNDFDTFERCVSPGSASPGSK